MNNEYQKLFVVMRNDVVENEKPFDQDCCKQIRLLIVEDYKDLAQTLAMFFEVEGFFVAVETNPIAALQLAERNGFDAFLIDIGLDSISGIELARRLRKIPSLKSAILIAITGLGETYRNACLTAGFDNFFYKTYGYKKYC